MSLTDPTDRIAELSREVADLRTRVAALEREQGAAGGEPRVGDVYEIDGAEWRLLRFGENASGRSVAWGRRGGMSYDTWTMADELRGDRYRLVSRAAAPTPPADKAGPAPGYRVEPTGRGTFRLVTPAGAGVERDTEALAIAATWEHAKAAAAEAPHAHAAQQPAGSLVRIGDTWACGNAEYVIGSVRDGAAYDIGGNELTLRGDGSSGDYGDHWRLVSRAQQPATSGRGEAVARARLGKAMETDHEYALGEYRQLQADYGQLREAVHRALAGAESSPPQDSVLALRVRELRCAKAPDQDAPPPRTRSALTVAADAVQREALGRLCLDAALAEAVRLGCGDAAGLQELAARYPVTMLAAFAAAAEAVRQKVEDELREAAKGGE